MMVPLRKILHIDMDCFFAAVEILLQPQLAHVPLGIGGRPKQRSVLCTCNYEARKFGVHSAMSVDYAMRICPQLKLLTPRMSLYQKYSNKIFDILAPYAQKMETMGMDEAYLDVTESSFFGGSATLLAEHLQKKIFEEIGLHASIGVAPNKFLAKVASDWKKPRGLFVITPESAFDFCTDLPVKKINGVGKVLAKKMLEQNIRTCGDLRKFGQDELLTIFGKIGQALFYYARGLDHRPVAPPRQRKTLGLEHTYLESKSDLDSCLNETPTLLSELSRRLNQLQNEKTPPQIKKAFVKLKDDDFNVITREKITPLHFFTPLISGEINSSLEVFFRDLLIEAHAQLSRPIRLIGLGVKFWDELPLAEEEEFMGRQLTFFDLLKSP